MKIEHVAMYVNDLDTAKEFFVSLLGGVTREQRNYMKIWDISVLEN